MILEWRQLYRPPWVALLATIRGNLQMFPVPTTEPIMEKNTPREEENCKRKRMA